MAGKIRHLVQNTITGFFAFAAAATTLPGCAIDSYHLTPDYGTQIAPPPDYQPVEQPTGSYKPLRNIANKIGGHFTDEEDIQFRERLKGKSSASSGQFIVLPEGDTNSVVVGTEYNGISTLYALRQDGGVSIYYGGNPDNAAQDFIGNPLPGAVEGRRNDDFSFPEFIAGRLRGITVADEISFAEDMAQYAPVLRRLLLGGAVNPDSGFIRPDGELPDAIRNDPSLRAQADQLRQRQETEGFVFIAGAPEVEVAKQSAIRPPNLVQAMYAKGKEVYFRVYGMERAAGFSLSQLIRDAAKNGDIRRSAAQRDREAVTLAALGAPAKKSTREQKLEEKNEAACERVYKLLGQYVLMTGEDGKHRYSSVWRHEDGSPNYEKIFEAHKDREGKDCLELPKSLRRENRKPPQLSPHAAPPPQQSPATNGVRGIMGCPPNVRNIRGVPCIRPGRQSSNRPLIGHAHKYHA